MVRLISCVLVIGLACGGTPGPDSAKPKPAEPGRLLVHVPADTPYVIGALEPPPRPLRQFMQRGFERSISKLLASTAQLTDDARRALDPWTRFRAALVDEVRNKPVAEWWTTLGLDLSAPFVVYGLGPWPVFRLEVPDAARVRQVLGRALAQVQMRSGRIGHRSYWSYANDDGLEIVVAVLDREAAQPAQLILALVPATAKERLLTRPASTLLDAKVLPDMTARHRLSRIMLGFLDISRAVSVLGSTSLDEPLRSAIGPTIASCRGELDRVAGAFPRLVFGYRTIDDVHFDATLVLEAQTQITGGLAKLRTAVPGVVASQTTGAMLGAGVAVDVDGFVAWGSTIVRDLRARPFACPLLTWINDGADVIDQVLGSPVMHLLRGGRGVSFSLDAVDPATKSVTADVLVAGNNVAGLVTLATSLIPQLSNLVIKPDGEPVELPLDGLGIPWVTSAHLALRDDRIAIAVGPGSHDRVRTRLASRAPQRSPLAVFSGNGARFQKALELLGQRTNEDERTDEIGDFTFHLDVSDAGIGVDMLGSW